MSNNDFDKYFFFKVGYSATYAKFFNLTILQPKQEFSWPCYECPAKFRSSEELQNHLSVHDDIKDENTKPKKKNFKYVKRLFKKYQTEAVECNICKDVFYQYNYNFLKTHIGQKHGISKESVENYFSIVE